MKSYDFVKWLGHEASLCSAQLMHIGEAVLYCCALILKAFKWSAELCGSLHEIKMWISICELGDFEPSLIGSSHIMQSWIQPWHLGRPPAQSPKVRASNWVNCAPLGGHPYSVNWRPLSSSPSCLTYESHPWYSRRQALMTISWPRSRDPPWSLAST